MSRSIGNRYGTLQYPSFRYKPWPGNASGFIVETMRRPGSPYHQNIAQDDSRSASLINRCNLPPWIIGDEAFQANPRPIEIDGVRDTDGRFFRRLDEVADPNERSRLFHDYVCVKFGLDDSPEGRQRSRSYPDYLRAWGADSNSHSGAVLKAWAESRFGLLATYHKGLLADDASAREAFVLDRMRGAAKTIGVLMQFDLLYTFCQDELRRRFPGQRWLTLYRGTHDPEEYTVRCRGNPCDGLFNRTTLVQLNNLSSFSSDPEVAWEFGSSAWEVQVPLPKIVFFKGLLPQLLMSESEHLVLGGYYKVRALIG